MTRVRHINAGVLSQPGMPRIPCHCLLLEDAAGLTLVDTGIGLLDCRDPEGRIGRQTIDAAGFRFDEADTAVRQLEQLGFDPADVTHIILTHGDPDHVGGLADFPEATVHVSAEEHAAIVAGDRRYAPQQFAHGPRWRAYPPNDGEWFGLGARPLELGFASDALLVPLFGHTRGHCGVAIRQGDGWLLHVGDAYYLRAELFDEAHPVGALAAASAFDDGQRRLSLDQLRRLARNHAEVAMCGYHDASEMS